MKVDKPWVMIQTVRHSSGHVSHKIIVEKMPVN